MMLTTKQVKSLYIDLTQHRYYMYDVKLISGIIITAVSSFAEWHLHKDGSWQLWAERKVIDGLG